MINSLDDAITHCLEVAEEQDKLATRYEDASGYSRTHIESLRTNESIKCRKCASEHRQLAEWLKELKAYEEAREEIACLPIVWEEGAGIRKCIDILDKHLMEVNADE